MMYRRLAYAGVVHPTDERRQSVGSSVLVGDVGRVVTRRLLESRQTDVAVERGMFAAAVTSQRATAAHSIRHCWLVEQGLTSHSTQFRSFRRRCSYRSDDPTNSVKALKEGG